jgi:hypothetical protein
MQRSAAKASWKNEEPKKYANQRMPKKLITPVMPRVAGTYAAWKIFPSQ